MVELLALRWRHVDFSAAKLLVEGSWSAGRLTTPKSRKWRAVQLADQPAALLAQLGERARFTVAALLPRESDRLKVRAGHSRHFLAVVAGYPPAAAEALATIGRQAVAKTGAA